MALQVGINAGVERRLGLRLGGVEVLFEGQFLGSDWQRRKDVDSIDEVYQCNQVVPIMDQTSLMGDAVLEVSGDDGDKVEELIFFCKVDQILLLLRVDLRRPLEIVGDFLFNVQLIPFDDADDQLSLV